MKSRGLKSFLITALAGFLGLAAGPCTSSTSLLCPADSADDGYGSCVSDTSLTDELDIATALGTPLPSFYYLGNSTGFVLGNGQYFSRNATASQTLLIPDITASFAKGPLLSPGTITEAFTAVAVYSPTQAANAYSNGYGAYDAVSGVYSDLTGYIVAVGFALTSHGTVAGLIARYTPRGALDTTFHGTGYILGDSTVFTSGSFTMLKAVAIDSQGRVVVGGYGNAQPTFSGYLTWLETLTDGDPILLQQAGEELQAVLVRYLPDGSLDTDGFDTSAIESPASGSAVDGFATSPVPGFFGTAATVGRRYDVIYGLAVDGDDGIFAVGATAISANPGPTSESALIVHYSSQGELLTWQRGKDGTGTDFLGASTHEYFTSVAVDADGNAVAAGNSGLVTPAGGPTVSFDTDPLVARFTLTSAGTDNEVLALDTSFMNPDGFKVDTAVAGAPSSTIKSLALDPTNDVYILSGHALNGLNKQALVFTVGASTPFTVSPTPLVGPATGYSTSAVGLDSLHGVAVITSGGTTRYMGVGSSRFDSVIPVTHSLVTSITPALALDPAFAVTPYSEADPLYTLPNTLLPSFVHPTTGSSNWNPFSLDYFGKAVPQIQIAGTQLGPDLTAYGGGLTEKFNAIAPSADGTHAVVVGYTTDSAATAALVGPPAIPALDTTRRSFPILLIYRLDGNFVNPGDYSDFYTLQSEL